MIRFSYIGYEFQNIQVSDASKPLDILLRVDLQGLMGEVVVVNRKDDKYIDLRIVDEDGISINQEDIYIGRLLLDEDGKEDFEDIEFKYIGDTELYRIYWGYGWGLQDENSIHLKEGTLRISAEGYEEPIIITVRCPKRHSKKTIRFKHKKVLIVMQKAVKTGIFLFKTVFLSPYVGCKDRSASGVREKVKL